MRHALIVSLVLTAAASAQSAVTATSHPLPAALNTFDFNTKGALWTATFQGHPEWMLGGSLWVNKSSLLVAASPLVRVLGGIPPGILPVAIVAEPALPAYHGLGADGAWYSQTLPIAPTSIAFADDMCVLAAGNTAYVFNVWQRAWVSQPFVTPTPFLRGVRSIVAVVDSSDIYAFSSFGHGAVRLQTAHPSINYVPGTPNSRIETDRSVMVFETGTNEFSVFSAFRQVWTRVPTTGPVAAVPVTMDKAMIIFKDVAGNALHLYSGLTGNVTTLNFADVNQVTYDKDDTGIHVYDPLAGQLTIMRGVDDGLVTVFGLPTPPVLLQDNDWRVLRTGNRFDALSTTIKGAAFTSINPVGETVITTSGNDSIFMVQTDQALYAFSAFLNAWARQPYSGSITAPRPQDFIAHAYSASTHYVFSSRGGAWHSRPLQAGATVGDTDSVAYAKEPGNYTVFGCDSTQFQTQVLSAGTRLTDGSDDNSLFSIHNDPSGPGSVIHYYGRMNDKWKTFTTGFRLTSVVNEVRRFDEGLALLLPNEILTLSAFGDITVQLPHPLDNVDHHALTNMATRFMASAEPFDAAVLLIGLGQGEVPVPGVAGCPFLLDPIRPFFLVPLGGFDNRGVLQFTVTLPDSPAVIYLQMLAVGTPLAELGHRHTLQVH